MTRIHTRTGRLWRASVRFRATLSPWAPVPCTSLPLVAMESGTAMTARHRYTRAPPSTSTGMPFERRAERSVTQTVMAPASRILRNRLCGPAMPRAAPARRCCAISARLTAACPMTGARVVTPAYYSVSSRPASVACERSLGAGAGRSRAGSAADGAFVSPNKSHTVNWRPPEPGAAGRAPLPRAGAAGPRFMMARSIRCRCTPWM